MKILVISNYYPPSFVGGAEIYAYRLAKEFFKMGHQIEIVTSFANKPSVRKEEGILVHRITKMPPLWRITGKLLGHNWNPYSYRIKNVIENFDPDIIHIHAISGTIQLYPLVKYLKGSKVVCHLHDHWPICYTGTLYNMQRGVPCEGKCIQCSFKPFLRTIGRVNLWWRDRLLTIFEKNVDLFISPSGYLKKTLLVHNFSVGDKIIHIPLGIDLDEFNPWEKVKPPRVVFVGRMVSYKNPMMALKLAKAISGIHVDMIGNGPEIPKLIAVRKDWELEKRVKIYGQVKVEEVKKIINRAICLIVPSVCPENSPMTIYEALASGVIPIVTNLGGPKELIGTVGTILDPFDDTLWIETINSLINNSDVLTEKIKNARKLALDLYSIRYSALKVIEVMEALIQ